MQGNEEDEWMVEPKDKTILTSKLQMINKSLNDNYRSEEFGIQKFEVSVLGYRLNQ
jgi:hypothetical protein